MYHADAQEAAFALYCQGWSDEQIEKEMRKTWPTFTRQVLYGEGGWKKKFNWEERRSKADAKRKELGAAIESAEELIIHCLTDALGFLAEKVARQGSEVKAEDLAQMNKLSTTLNNVKKRMETGGAGDKASLFLAFLTEFLSFMKEKDKDYAEQFERDFLDEFIERIKA